MAEALRVRVAPLNVKSMNTQCSIHWMPCKIAHSGDAKVTEYFENSVRNADDVYFSGEQAVKSASFRGRPLQGKTIKLPPNCEGIVLKEDQISFSDEEERNLVPKATFDSFCYWNLDTKPTDNDTICKAFQWVEIANVLHGSVGRVDQEESLEPTPTDR